MIAVKQTETEGRRESTVDRDRGKSYEEKEIMAVK